jgi:hypothetical protein
MSASIQMYQWCSGQQYAQGIGLGSNDWDFKNKDAPGPSAGAADAIRAGDFSYHVYLRAYFNQPASGVNWSSISNIKYYGSSIDLSGYGDGAYILAKDLTTYTPATGQSMSGIWDVLPTTASSGVDISTSGLVTGTPGWTEWVGLQLKTNSTNALPGQRSYQYFTLIWDEI